MFCEPLTPLELGDRVCQTWMNFGKIQDLTVHVTTNAWSTWGLLSECKKNCGVFFTNLGLLPKFDIVSVSASNVFIWRKIHLKNKFSIFVKFQGRFDHPQWSQVDQNLKFITFTTHCLVISRLKISKNTKFHR